jgi:hypothetical protein
MQRDHISKDRTPGNQIYSATSYSNFAFLSSIMSKFLIVLIFSLFTTLVVAQAPRSCYWPDGTTLTTANDAYEFTACFSGDSQCCAKEEVCLSKGLCFSRPEGKFHRGACTDKTWSTSPCPQYCKNSQSSGQENNVNNCEYCRRLSLWNKRQST